MDSNLQGKNTNGSNTDNLDSNPYLMDSNLIGQIIIRREVYMLDSNHSVPFEVRSQGELHGFESLLKDSNHLRKIEDRTENKQID